jgi:hypothetical protein
VTESIPVENRKYPRIALGSPGAIETSEGEGSRIDVIVRDLSCEGAGLDLPDGATIQPGMVVDLQLELEGIPIRLPARVVWAAGRRAGLRLRLADTAPEAKKAFGAWIAPLTKQALASKAAG